MPTPASEAARASLPAVLAAHAAMLARAGQLAQAEQWLAALIDGHGDGNGSDGTAGLHCLLGKVQAQQGRVDAAKLSLRAALQLDAAYAGARAAIDSLEGGQPALRRRMLVGGGAALCVLAGAAWWLARRDQGAVGPQPPLAVAPAASAVIVLPRNQSVATAATAATDPVGAPLSAVDHYASLVVDLGRFADIASLQPRAVAVDAKGLQVRLTGTVPSAHVLDRIRAVVARHPQLRVDATSVAIDHRYRVRRGDSLSSIAARLYGRADRWPALWRANRHTIGAPRRLTPGTMLVVP